MSNTGARPDPDSREPVLRPMTHPQKEYYALLARTLALYIERELPLEATWATGRAGALDALTYSFVVERQGFLDAKRELAPYDPKTRGLGRARFARTLRPQDVAEPDWT